MQKKRKKVVRNSLKLLASGCPERQDVPGVRMFVVSGLSTSVVSHQDVLLRKNETAKKSKRNHPRKIFRTAVFKLNIVGLSQNPL